jgi:hypothetical protein
VGGDCGGGGVVCCCDGNVRQVESGVRQPEAEFVLHWQIVVVEVAVVDQEAFFEIGLPGVGIGGVEQRAGVCDVCERVVAFLFGDGVGEVAGGVDGAVEDVDDAVAYFLAAEVGCEDRCDVWVVGEAGFVGLVDGLTLVGSKVWTYGSTFNPPLCVTTMVLAQLSATVLAKAVPFQSTSKLSRSAPSVAHVFKKTRQTSGAG